MAGLGGCRCGQGSSPNPRLWDVYATFRLTCIGISYEILINKCSLCLCLLGWPTLFFLNASVPSGIEDHAVRRWVWVSTDCPVHGSIKLWCRRTRQPFCCGLSCRLFHCHYQGLTTVRCSVLLTGSIVSLPAALISSGRKLKVIVSNKCS